MRLRGGLLLLCMPLVGCVTWVQVEVTGEARPAAGEPPAKLELILSGTRFAPGFGGRAQAVLEGPVAARVIVREAREPLVVGPATGHCAGLEAYFPAEEGTPAFRPTGPTAVIERGWVIPPGWGTMQISVFSLGLWPVVAPDGGYEQWRVTVFADVDAAPRAFTVGYTPRRFAWLLCLPIWPFAALEQVFRASAEEVLFEALAERLPGELTQP